MSKNLTCLSFAKGQKIENNFEKKVMVFLSHPRMFSPMDGKIDLLFEVFYALILLVVFS